MLLGGGSSHWGTLGPLLALCQCNCLHPLPVQNICRLGVPAAQGLAVPEVYAPAVELFLLAGAEVAVGSLASRTAVIAANIRSVTALERQACAWGRDTWPLGAAWRWP